MTLPTNHKNKSTWFIADLHLDPSHPQLFSLFTDFIDSISEQAEALYILGDLFEAWIGDDILDAAYGEPYQPLVTKLKQLSDSGVALYFMQGNRDFLAQESFANRIGAELLPDQKVINLYGKKALLMHGDTLCTDDKSYQRMRWLFHSKLFQFIYLRLSLENRAAKAQSIRSISKNKTQKKQTMILDVNQAAVEKEMLRHKVSLLIHGHTHRPAEHSFKINDNVAKRIVLGDWHTKACYLRVDKDGFECIY